MFRQWNSFIRIIEDRDIVPYQNYDAPSSSDFEWDLPISTDGQYFPIFPPLETFKPRIDPLTNEQEYYLTVVDFPIANHVDLLCIVKELNRRIPSKETTKATLIPIKTYLQRTTLEIVEIDFEINPLIPLAHFKEMDSNLDGIEDQDFGITNTPELGIIWPRRKIVLPFELETSALKFISKEPHESFP
ncbi:unnamed protein product [Lactuca virosa]|uniref:Uncharacterized protein n=1 Tax=Lactuca virosa TaxID=75947 RepID=A0AAU9PTP3_9ASTR|nr:unnamed protein product [Lactuca virosa]